MKILKTKSMRKLVIILMKITSTNFKGYSVNIGETVNIGTTFPTISNNGFTDATINNGVQGGRSRYQPCKSIYLQYIRPFIS